MNDIDNKTKAIIKYINKAYAIMEKDKLYKKGMTISQFKYLKRKQKNKKKAKK